MIFHVSVLILSYYWTLASSSTGEMQASTPNPIIAAMETFGFKIAFPSNSNFSCFYSNESDCQRLEFKTEIDSFPILSARIFFTHGLESSDNLMISWPFVSKSYHYEDEWVYFDGIPCLQRIENNSYHCDIEILGKIFADNEEQVPFLVVSSSRQNRRRRATPSCALQDHFVSAKDLGMDVAHPATINIKKCVGECHVNYGTFKNHYARTMYLFHKRNELSITNETWKPICQITGFEDIHLFFNVSEGNKTKIEEGLVQNLVVSSCGCHNCLEG